MKEEPIRGKISVKTIVDNWGQYEGCVTDF